MMLNYNPLDPRRDTWSKNDVGDTTGNMRTSARRYRWLCQLLLACLILTGQGVLAQVNYTQNFDTNAGSWTGFTRFTGTTACGGAGGAMRVNLYSSGTSTSVLPSLGTSDGNLHQVSIDYKVAAWSANNVGTSGN